MVWVFLEFSLKGILRLLLFDLEATYSFLRQLDLILKDNLQISKLQNHLELLRAEKNALSSDTPC
jgi:hypothetical protein